MSWAAVADQWFSPDILVSSTNKTGSHNITEILLKVALNTITNPFIKRKMFPCNILHNMFFKLI
jgi:hypothetical protein